jgi:hypothetical protein
MQPPFQPESVCGTCNQLYINLDYFPDPSVGLAGSTATDARRILESAGDIIGALGGAVCKTHSARSLASYTHKNQTFN